MINLYYKRILSLTAVLAAGAWLPQRMHAQAWTNGQAATYVIGQAAFGTGVNATSATGLHYPEDIAVDPITGKVFVSDWVNSRVLRYPSTAALTNGAAAEAVLGQSGFTSQSIGTSSTAMNHPAGLALDAGGNLWVADEENSRVLWFANAVSIASGAAASGVLGQAGFTTKTTGLSQSAMSTPYELYASGTTLWVSDYGNNRILRFDNAASAANGGPADAVIGQTGFTTNASGVSSTALDEPRGVYVDAADNLWVADNDNFRVLMFPNATGYSNGEAATLVLGQTGFTTRATAASSSEFGPVYGITGDGAGRLYVSDGGNSRIMIFDNAAGLTNGAAASNVLGQGVFTTSAEGNAATALTQSRGVLATTDALFVADNFNSRVVIYTPAEPLPLLLVGFTGRLQDNGQALLQWQVSDQNGPAPGSGNAGSTQLEYSTTDTTGFTDILNTQPVNPAVSGYSYVQVSPAVGPNYYRVKLTLPGGATTYSQIVTITMGSAASSGLSIYPNPASGTVVMMLPPLGKAVIEVYNSVGGLMQRLSTASTINTLTVSGWAAGMYTVRVTQGKTSTTGSVVIVK